MVDKKNPSLTGEHIPEKNANSHRSEPKNIGKSTTIIINKIQSDNIQQQRSVPAQTEKVEYSSEIPKENTGKSVNTIINKTQSENIPQPKNISDQIKKTERSAGAPEKNNAALTAHKIVNKIINRDIDYFTFIWALPDKEKEILLAAALRHDPKPFVEIFFKLDSELNKDEQEYTINHFMENKYFDPNHSAFYKIFTQNILSRNVHNGVEILPPDQIKIIIKNAEMLLPISIRHQKKELIEKLKKSITSNPIAIFKMYINNESIPDHDKDKIAAVRNKLETDLKNPLNYTLNAHFNNMTEANKVEFISALLTNDKSKVKHFLTSLPLAYKPSEEKYFQHIAYLLDSDDNKYFLNSTVRLLINLMLGPSNHYTDEKNKMILTSVMSNIPDHEISLKIKGMITEQIDPWSKHIFMGYNEPVKPQMKSKSSGVVSLEEFNAAAKDNKIDYSQFILLSLGVLQSTSKNHQGFTKILQEIRNDYMNINYEQAIEKIKILCTDPYYQQIINSSSRNNVISQTILAASSSLTATNEVEISKNYSRRFLENRISALYFANAMNFNSINRIASFFLPYHFEPVHNVSSTIKLLTALPEHPDDLIANRKAELQSQYAGDYNKKGRELRAGFYAQEFEPQLDPSVYAESSYSQNRGVMRANQPNYPDELANKTMRNTQPDINTYVQDNDYYPLKNKRSAYVASISGHTYYFVAMLEKYMKANQPSSDEEKIKLSQDINNVLQAYISTYVGKGYHSYLECFHVLQDKTVQDLFLENGVQLKLTWPENLLEQAFKDAQAYTKTTALSSTVQHEILNSSNAIFGAIQSGDTKKFIELIRGNPSLKNVIDNEGRTPLSLAIELERDDMVKTLSARTSSSAHKPTQANIENLEQETKTKPRR